MYSLLQYAVMELYPQVCYILLLTKLWITMGFGINKNFDNKSKELCDGGAYLFFIPICFKTQNIANYSY